MILFLSLVIDTGFRQLERLAHGDFGRAESWHGPGAYRLAVLADWLSPPPIQAGSQL